MHTQRTHKNIFRGGAAMLVLGVMLGLTGLVSSQAGASETVTICHRTDSVTNPYRKISVDLSATHGPDHATHTGPVFDPTVNTSNKIPWGDIIPDVLNWDESGRAIYDADCQMPGEPADPEVCQYNDELDATDPLCVPPVSEPQVCPEGQTGVWPACVPDVTGPQVCPEGQTGVWPSCTTPQQDPGPQVCPEGQTGVWPACTTPPENPGPQVCPRGQVGTPPSCTTPQQDPDPTPPVVAPVVQDTPAVTPEVVQPTQQAAGTEVKGLVLVAKPATTPAPAAAALPRTGTETLPLTQLGLGLLLLGAGALIIGRDRTVII